MPEILPDHVPNPIAIIGWDGTRYNVIGIDAAFHVQVDVIATALAAGAATAANQALILAQLQLIEDLRNALQSVDTDRLQVRGQDRLFSFNDEVAITITTTLIGDGGYIDTLPVPDNLHWCITNIVAWNADRATTIHVPIAFHNATNIFLGDQIQAFAAGDKSRWSGLCWIDYQDVIRVFFVGGLAGDTCSICLEGYSSHDE